MTDQAIAWVQATRSLTPDRPFLMYYSSSAGHPPHTPPKAWLEKGLYKGEFDQGWDALREQILARQKADGDRRRRTPSWPRTPTTSRAGTRLSEDEKTVYTRQMEVYATLVESADHEVGPPGRRDRGARRARQHAVHLHRRRQRRLVDRRHQRRVRRVGPAQRRAGGHPLPAEPARRVRRPDAPTRTTPSAGPSPAPTPATWCIQMAHGGGNMAGTVVHWPERHRGQGRDPPPVHQRHRRRPDDPRGRRHPRAQGRQRRRADPDGRRQHGATPSTTPTRPSATPPSTTRSPATAASTTTAGSPRSCTAPRGSPRRGRRASTTTGGSCTTWPRTSAWPTTSPTSTPTSSRR